MLKYLYTENHSFLKAKQDQAEEEAWSLQCEQTAAAAVAMREKSALIIHT